VIGLAHLNTVQYLSAHGFMSNYYIGIDIGGTNTRIVLLHGLRPQRVWGLAFPTPRNRKVVEAEICKKILHLANGIKLSGIGVGVAGVVSQKKKRVEVAEHLKFLEGWDPIAFFSKAFRAPVKMENDARCFLRAESLWGNARGKKNILGIAIGTGIGGAIMIDGKIYRGTHEVAGEVGDLVLERGRTFETSAAKMAFRRWGDRNEVIGRSIAGLISIVNPELIVLGGGAVAKRKVSLPAIKKTVRRFAVTQEAAKTPIVFGKLGDAAQAIGAALLFADR